MRAPRPRQHPAFTSAPIIAINERIRALRQRGIDVISFGIGESDLGTPKHVSEAVRQAATRDQTSCTPPTGALPLRQALATWFTQQYERPFTSDEVLVAPGSKYGLYTLFLATLDPGDEVLIPVPAWPTIGGLVASVGARPIYLPCSGARGFVPDPAELARAVTPRTRSLYLANPGNPTGVVLSQEALEPLVRFCREHDLLLISDGAYRSHCYEGTVPNLPALAEKHDVACAIVETLSKRYSMSGWRVGFIAGHADLIATMADIQAQTLSCPSTIPQDAALAAITGPQDVVATAVAAFAERRQAMLAEVRTLPHFSLRPIPTGAFFLFPEVTAALGKRTPDGRTLDTDGALAAYLLDTAHVAVVPGNVFGSPGYLRMSYTLDQARIVEGCQRIRTAMEKLT